jgi:molybdopterin converting factor small subunit
MQIKLFLSSTLRASVPGYDAQNGIDVTLQGPMPVEALCQKMNIPSERVKMVMINGAHARMDYVLKGGERVGLFPPVGGG